MSDKQESLRFLSNGLHLHTCFSYAHEHAVPFTLFSALSCSSTHIAPTTRTLNGRGIINLVLPASKGGRQLWARKALIALHVPRDATCSHPSSIGCRENQCLFLLIDCALPVGPVKYSCVRIVTLHQCPLVWATLALRI